MLYKKVWVYFFSTRVWHIFHSKKNKRGVIINVLWSTCKVPLILIIFKKKNLSLFVADFRKCSNIDFHGKPSNGRRVVFCGRTDRYDEADSRFRNFANAPKNQHWRKCPCEKAFFIWIGRKFISGEDDRNKKCKWSKQGKCEITFVPKRWRLVFLIMWK